MLPTFEQTLYHERFTMGIRSFLGKFTSPKVKTWSFVPVQTCCKGGKTPKLGLFPESQRRWGMQVPRWRVPGFDVGAGGGSEPPLRSGGDTPHLNAIRPNYIEHWRVATGSKCQKDGLQSLVLKREEHCAQ